jgi:hypothetical protein
MVIAHMLTWISTMPATYVAGVDLDFCAKQDTFIT